MLLKNNNIKIDRYGKNYHNTDQRWNLNRFF